MKLFLLLCSLSATSFYANARPDVSLGYSYNPPSTSYGVPSNAVDTFRYNNQRSSFNVGLSGSPTSPPTTLELPYSGVQNQQKSFVGGNIHAFGVGGTASGNGLGSSSTGFTGGAEQNYQIGFSSGESDSSGLFNLEIGGQQHPGFGTKGNFFGTTDGPSFTGLTGTGGLGGSGIFNTAGGVSGQHSLFGTGQGNPIGTTAQQTGFNSIGGSSSATSGSGSLVSSGVGLGAGHQQQTTGGFTLAPSFGVTKSEVSSSSGLGGHQTDFSASSRFGSSVDSQSQFSSRQNLQTEVRRNIYVFDSPDEPEVIRPRINFIQSAPQRRDNILFIKTPIFRFAPVRIPAQQQSEERTRIYVLVNKPEAAHIDIGAAANVAPTKPEVQFIRYRTPNEASEAVSNIQNGQTSGSYLVNAKSIQNAQDLINSIGRDINTNVQSSGDEGSSDFNQIYLRSGQQSGDQQQQGNIGGLVLGQHTEGSSGTGSQSGQQSGTFYQSSIKTQSGAIDGAGTLQSGLVSHSIADEGVSIETSTPSLSAGTTLSNVISGSSGGDSSSGFAGSFVSGSSFGGIGGDLGLSGSTVVTEPSASALGSLSVTTGDSLLSRSSLQGSFVGSSSSSGGSSSTGSSTEPHQVYGAPYQ